MRQKCEQIQNLRFQGADIVGEMQNVSKQMEKEWGAPGLESTAFWIRLWKGQMQLCGMMEQPVRSSFVREFCREVWRQILAAGTGEDFFAENMQSLWSGRSIL